jgi:hypothetical protein
MRADPSIWQNISWQIFARLNFLLRQCQTETALYRLAFRHFSIAALLNFT